MIEPLSPETLAWLHQAAAAGVAEPRVLLHLMKRLVALENDCIEQSQSSRFCNEAIVRRLEALEASDKIDADAWASMRRASSDYQRRLLNLEAAQQQPPGHLCGATKMVTAPEGAPVADHSDLRTFHGIALDMVDTLPILPEIKRTLRRAIREPMQQPTPEAAPMATDQELLNEWEAHSTCTAALRAVYNLNRQPSAAELAQPTPPPAAVAGLMNRLRSAVRLSGGSLMDDEWEAAIHEVAAWLDLEGYVRAANDLREEIAK